MSVSTKGRIGVFGGSFHPPHKGHVEAAKRFLDAANLDFLFVVPDYQPPHRTLPEGASALDRYEMTRIAFLPLGSRVRVMRTELDSGAARYTADTLSEYVRDFPEYEFYLYLGSDLFLEFEKWHEFEKIFSLATLAVLSRNNDEDAVLMKKRYFEETYRARILYLGQSPRVSSTEIRKKLSRGVCPAAIDPSVFEYIVNRNLYRATQET